MSFFSRIHPLHLLHRLLLLGPMLLALVLLSNSIPYSTVFASTISSKDMRQFSAWRAQGIATTIPEGGCGMTETSMVVAMPCARHAGLSTRSQLVPHGRLAPTVKILDSLPPTTILQFPLVPSGIKSAFPNAIGLVTIVRGNRDDSTSDTVTVDVQKMPPNITFTVFFIQFANKPFGNVEYVADLTTRGDGSGETVFNIISLVAFAMDARDPGTSTDDREGLTSGTNLDHLGMWFSSQQDAQQVLKDDSLPGTLFDGGSPPLHAGPQAMTDGQTAPVF